MATPTLALSLSVWRGPDSGAAEPAEWPYAIMRLLP